MFGNTVVTTFIFALQGFLSWKLAIDCKAFVTSFVLDSDLVPRLSLENMEKLRDQTLDLIGVSTYY